MSAVPETASESAKRAAAYFFSWKTPLWAAFAVGAVDDPDLRIMASLPSREYLNRLKEGTPVPPFIFILLFSAAETVLHSYPGDPLAAYYPSLTTSPAPAENAFPSFRAFCLKHRAAIEELVRTRSMQTTLIDRAGLILAGARKVAGDAGEPLSLIEIGCSAGLLTLFDHWQYDFGPQGRFGDESRPLVKPLAWIGNARPPVGPPPRIGERVGLDLNPVNVADPLERLWIESLVPPDWVDQRQRLAAAISYRANTPLRTIAGDAMQSLPGLLREMSGQIMVMHTYCLYQWPAAAHAALDAVLREAGKTRPVYRFAVDAVAGARPPELPAMRELHAPHPFDMFITRYSGGNAKTTVLGAADPWGLACEWVGQ